MPERRDLNTLLAHRSVTAVFSDPVGLTSHRVRIVLAEKDVAVEVVDVAPERYPPALAEINPYVSLPVLVERDLVLYDQRVIMEYLDERYPHPPLLPAYPVTRAELRQLLYRVERDWFTRAEAVANPRSSEKTVVRARAELRDELIAVAPLFAGRLYFLSDEHSLVDCSLAALLWRLPALGIELPATRAVKPLHDYMQRQFGREAFRLSLSAAETEIRRH